MHRHPLDFLLEDPDDQGPGRHPPERCEREDTERYTSSAWQSLAGVYPPTEPVDVIVWCRAQGENLIVALLNRVPFRVLFDAYTAGGTIRQCSFQHFQSQVSTFGKIHDVPPSQRRKRPRTEHTQPTEPRKGPMPIFYHFWERDPYSTSQ